MSKTKTFIVEITDPNFVPDDGSDLIDYITDVLSHAFVPCYIEEQTSEN